MKKREIRRDDGRYLIYYSFEAEDTVATADETAGPSEGGSTRKDTPDEKGDNRDQNRR